MNTTIFLWLDVHDPSHPLSACGSHPLKRRWRHGQVVGVANAVAQQQLLEVEAQAMAKAPAQAGENDEHHRKTIGKP